MKTIAFEQWKNGSARESTSCEIEDSNGFAEDIITIDSQIELKVRGELPETKILNGATAFMEQKMVCFLEYEYDQFKLSNDKVLDGVINFDPGQEPNPAVEELKKIHLQKFSEITDLKSRSHRKNKFLFSIEPGFEIIIPPYDSELTNSFASFSSANKVSGSFKSSPKVNGYGASGIGVFLSPTTDILAGFRPHCPVSYSWANFISEGGGYAASRGGVGITVYNASLGSLVKDDYEVLWDQSRRPAELEISGGSDDLYFQSTSIGQSHFEMKARQTYLVWMWCWAFADSGPNAAAYANIDCKVPFMIVDSSTI